jgi:hypothetical protein
MKKSLFLMAAASALMLTACTSEDDVVQSSASQKAEAKAVGFDVYTPAATNVTRAGLEGTMTTGRLQRSGGNGGGFGVYAYLVEDEVPASGDANATTYKTWITSSSDWDNPKMPNFMVNEKLLWNETNQGWYYSPLKYWPNETDNDSQTPAAEMIGSASTSYLDRLTFFAYAPYVKETNFSASSYGILGFTGKDGKLTYNSISDNKETNDPTGITEASIKYKASINDPNKAVDLLWGVAPAGGLTYTAVNGRTVTVKEGEPLMDMTKPDVNTNMKFLFQHALARIGVKAVAAIDQVGAGGTLDPNTKITIEKITLTGYFGETGLLNLNNKNPNVANWVNINDKVLATGTTKAQLAQTTLTLRAHEETVGSVTYPISIAEHLRFINTGSGSAPFAQTDRVGVTTVKQDVIDPVTYSATTPWVSLKTLGDGDKLEYSETTPYYDAANCATKRTATVYVDESTPSSDSKFVYTVNDKGVYTESSNKVELTYPEVNKYYTLTFKQIIESGVPASGEILKASVTSGTQLYTRTTESSINYYTPEPTGTDLTAGKYVIVGEIKKAPAYYTTAGDYYKRDANYFMVVPTNNIEKICTTNFSTDEAKKELNTVRVMIEYYITTEDSKLDAGRAQTKNVIEKNVVFPSIANGKSYNLNLVLGLTSVKMEAEVDDWKVINVQADLPQNTAD